MKGCDGEFATVVDVAVVVERSPMRVPSAIRLGRTGRPGRFPGAVAIGVGRFVITAGEVEEADGDAAVDVDAASVPLAVWLGRSGRLGRFSGAAPGRFCCCCDAHDERAFRFLSRSRSRDAPSRQRAFQRSLMDCNSRPASAKPRQSQGCDAAHLRIASSSLGVKRTPALLVTWGRVIIKNTYKGDRGGLSAHAIQTHLHHHRERNSEERSNCCRVAWRPASRRAFVARVCSS